MAITYEPIATALVSSEVQTVTISSIPSTYTDLRIVVFAKSSISNTYLRLNNISTSSYYYIDTYTNSTGSPSSYADTFSGAWMSWIGSWDIGFNTCLIDIPSYTQGGGAGLGKQVFAQYYQNDLGASGRPVTFCSTHAADATSAVTSILFHSGGASSVWRVGSRFTIYGIARA